MKKTRVAIGVIVALGAVWVGSAWYTGQQLESRMASKVAEANGWLQQNPTSPGVKISYQDYQRGIFSTQLKMVLTATPDAKASWLEPGQSVILNQTIDHGPFPAASLKSFNLIPALASVHTTLENNAATKDVFLLSKGISPFEVETRFSYDGATVSAISLRPLHSETDRSKLAFSGGNAIYSLDAQHDVMSLNGQIESAQIATTDRDNKKIEFTLRQLKTDSSSWVSNFGRLGEQLITLEQAAITRDGIHLAELNNIRIGGKTALAEGGKKINSQLDFALENLKVVNRPIGSGQLTLKTEGVDGEAMHQFMASLRRLHAQDKSAQENILATLPTLLKGGPTVTLSPLRWKNVKGESSLDLSVSVRDPAEVTGAAGSTAQVFDSKVKSLSMKLAIPIDMATELMTQIAQTMHFSPEDAAKQANQQVQQMIMLSKMFKLTTMQNNTISSDLHYADGQVTLNEQKMSLEKFLSRTRL